MAVEALAALVETAPAKINLTLHVAGRRADGYHLLESLVAFADVADTLTLEPASVLELAVTGPTAPAAGALEKNLVLVAARALVRRRPGLRVGAFALTKRLPAAAGIGGGSADAAAALRLLCTLNDISTEAEDVVAAARETGADVPVCLAGRARMMRGAGELLGPDVFMLSVPAVLVNPGIGLSTARVFAELGLVPGTMTGHAVHPDVPPRASLDDLFGFLAACRNDLEQAASNLVAEVGDGLAQLRRQNGCRLARMSGSGPTCYGLFDNQSAMISAVRALRQARPGWWIHPVIIGAQ